MDAQVITNIVDRWKANKISFDEASIALVMEGCDASDVKLLLVKD